MSRFKFLYIIALIAIIGYLTEAKERNTDYIIFGGVSLNLNLHSAKFAKLPGWETCCSEFDGGIGFGPQLTIGGIYPPESKLFGKKWRYGASISYADLSATLKSEEFIGYVIFEDSYTKGRSEFSLEGNISAVIVSPFLTIYPLDNIPMGINLGFESGLYLNSGFSHEERLLSPPGATYENYKTVRWEYSGDIPNVPSLYFSSLIGVNYEAFIFGNFKIIPHISYSHGLTDFTSAVDWSGSRLMAGVNFEYRVPAPAPPAPVPPPPPALPEPEQPEPLVMDLHIESLSDLQKDKKIYNDGDTLQMHAKIILTKELVAVKPEIFLSSNNEDIVAKNNKSDVAQSYADAYSKLPQAIAETIRNSPESKIILTANYTNTQKEAETKVNSFIEELSVLGVDKTNIIVNYNDLSDKKYRYPELEEEANNVKLSIDAKDDLIYLPHITNEFVDIETRTIKLVPTINREEIREINYSSSIDDINKINEFGVLELNVLNCLQLFENDMNITLSAEVIDNNNLRVKKSINLKITKNLKVTEELNSTIVTFKKAALGFFAFDRYSFEIIDNKVLEDAREQIKMGKKLILYAYTDNLGTAIYNDNLATKRAQTALELLNIEPDKVEVRYPETPPFNNNTPLGRKLNRSVFIELR